VYCAETEIDCVIQNEFCQVEAFVDSQAAVERFEGAIDLWNTRFRHRQDAVVGVLTCRALPEELAEHYRRLGAVSILWRKVAIKPNSENVRSRILRAISSAATHLCLTNLARV
jgi:hypothetical protein